MKSFLWQIQIDPFKFSLYLYYIHSVITLFKNFNRTLLVPVRIETGNIIEMWSVLLGDGSGINPVAVGNNRIYVTSETTDHEKTLHALNQVDGEVVWETSYNDDYYITIPAYADGQIYIQTSDSGESNLSAFNALDGTIEYQ